MKYLKKLINLKASLWYSYRDWIWIHSDRYFSHPGILSFSKTSLGLNPTTESADFPNLSRYFGVILQGLE